MTDFGTGSGYIFNICIIFCNNGGKIRDSGRDTRNPAPKPISQGIKRELFSPTLIAVITKDMHIDITKDMQKPLNNICRKLKPRCLDAHQDAHLLLI
jgi:hypothetical protein